MATELAERLPASLLLGVSGFVLLVVLVLLTAGLSARRPDGTADHGLRVVTLAVAAVPTFLSGSIALRWGAGVVDYPIAGAATLERLWLPATVVALSGVPPLARVLRAGMIAEAGQPYAAAARLRGSSAAGVLLRHVVRPATTPPLTMAGLSLASLLGGSVITEVVFSWPGVGAYAVEAISAQDYPVIQAYVLLMAATVVIVNRAVDLAQRCLDPRVAVDLDPAR